MRGANYTSTLVEVLAGGEQHADTRISVNRTAVVTIAFAPYPTPKQPNATQRALLLPQKALVRLPTRSTQLTMLKALDWQDGTGNAWAGKLYFEERSRLFKRAVDSAAPELFANLARDGPMRLHLRPSRRKAGRFGLTHHRLHPIKNGNAVPSWIISNC